MAQYVCTVCGYVYDEEKEGVGFDSLPDSWKCPLCGADKRQFEKKSEEKKSVTTPAESVRPRAETAVESYKSFGNGEMNILATNLAKGCEKQYLAEEAALFGEIADYYKNHSEPAKEAAADEISELLNNDLTKLYPSAYIEAEKDGDRGALRAVTWSDKVSKIVNMLLERYKNEGAAFLKNNRIFVCEICGFIYIGDKAPDVCPVCKVPKLKIHEVGRAQ